MLIEGLAPSQNEMATTHKRFAKSTTPTANQIMPHKIPAKAENANSVTDELPILGYSKIIPSITIPLIVWVDNFDKRTLNKNASQQNFQSLKSDQSKQFALQVKLEGIPPEQNLFENYLA